FSSDSKSLVSASSDGTLSRWEVASGKQQKLFKQLGGISHAALSPDGVMLAVWGFDQPGTIHLLAAATGKELRRLDWPSAQPGVRATVSALCFSSDGKTLFASSGTHLSVLRWDVTTGKELSFLGKNDGGLNGIALAAPDDRAIATV